MILDLVTDDLDIQWPLWQKIAYLLFALHKKAVEDEKYFAIFIDEMPLSFFEKQDYEDILISWQSYYPQIYLFLSISPSGRYLKEPVEVNFRHSDKVFATQLLTRH